MKYDIGFFSSCDRGLKTAIDIIPEAEAKLGRKITSVWAYGFQSYDAVHSGDPEKMKEKWELIRGMSDVGMVNKDRLSHEELAKLMKDTKVWFYPTEFTEINCITALKAQEAGCIPVTTGCYALEETVTNNKYTVKCEDITVNNEKREELITALVEAIQDEDYRSAPVPDVDWSDIAQKWDTALA